MPPSKKKIKESFDMSTGVVDVIEVDEGRHNYFSFRVTDDEKEVIERKIKKSKLKKSDYLRKCSMEKNIIVIEDLKDLIFAVSKIGNNVNQLTVAVHRGLANNTSSLEKFQGELEEVKKELFEISKKVKG